MDTQPVNIGWQLDKDLSERNGYMLEKELLTDVVIRIKRDNDEDAIIRAHKYMLVSASPVFWAMLCGELQQPGDVIIKDIDEDVFRKMLQFIYTERTDITGHDAMYVLEAAKRFQLPRLESYCSSYLQNEVDASNACVLLEQSKFFNNPELTERCMNEIEAFPKKTFSTDDFLTISRQSLQEILSKDELAISEVEIFERCFDWAVAKKGDNSSIRETLGDALYKIRFPTMPLKDFQNIPEKAKQMLTDKEMSDIIRYIKLDSHTEKDQPAKFNCKPRITVSENTRVPSNWPPACSYCGAQGMHPLNCTSCGKLLP